MSNEELTKALEAVVEAASAWDAAAQWGLGSEDDLTERSHAAERALTAACYEVVRIDERGKKTTADAENLQSRLNAIEASLKKAVSDAGDACHFTRCVEEKYEVVLKRLEVLEKRTAGLVQYGGKLT
jgi:predicted  nucleic acid-binding Zn-ribbon protein